MTTPQLDRLQTHCQRLRLYRVEAELNVLGTWVPWVYANPLELR